MKFGGLLSWSMIRVRTFKESGMLALLVTTCSFSGRVLFSKPYHTTQHRLRLNEDVAASTRFAPGTALVLVVGAFVILRLWHLTASCLWFDEIFSVHAARHDWSGLLTFVMQDLIHPPLFYMLLKVWISLGGDSLLWLRLFPAVTAIAMVVPFLLLCRELQVGAEEMTLALALLAINGSLIKYAQELRMYSLLLLLTVCSLWLFVRFCQARSSAWETLTALFAANLLLIYTHYYGWLLVVVEIIFLSLWERAKLLPFFMSVALLILCFSPWAYAVAQAAAMEKGFSQNLNWASRPNLASLFQYYVTLNQPLYFTQTSHDSLYLRWITPLFVLTLACPVVLWGWHWLNEARECHRACVGGRVWLFLFSFLPIGLAFVASHMLSYSVWGTRHLIIITAPYMILAATAIYGLRPVWLKSTILLLLGCWIFLSGLLFILKGKPNYDWCAWDGLARQMGQAEPDKTGPVRVYAFEDLVAYHLWFALDSAHEARFQVTVMKGIPEIKEDRAYFLPRGFQDVAVEDVSTLSTDHFWVAFRAPSWQPERPPLKVLTDKGYQFGAPLVASTSSNQAFIVPVWRR